MLDEQASVLQPALLGIIAGMRRVAGIVHRMISLNGCRENEKSPAEKARPEREVDPETVELSNIFGMIWVAGA